VLVGDRDERTTVNEKDWLRCSLDDSGLMDFVGKLFR
jgi:hypothetical protein